MNKLSVEGKKTRWGEEVLQVAWTPRQPTGIVRVRCCYENQCSEIKVIHKGNIFESLSEEKALILSLNEMKSFLQKRKGSTEKLTEDLYRKYMESKQPSLFGMEETQ